MSQPAKQRLIRDLVLPEIRKNLVQILVAALIGAIVGFFTGRAVEHSDTDDKGLSAEITRVVPRDGGKGIGREIRVSGTATRTPPGFQLRYAVHGRMFWYFSDTPLRVIDGKWEVDDSLGSANDTSDLNAPFTLAVVFGKADDFTRWRESKRPADLGIATEPDVVGLHVLADLLIHRTR